MTPKNSRRECRRSARDRPGNKVICDLIRLAISDLGASKAFRLMVEVGPLAVTEQTKRPQTQAQREALARLHARRRLGLCRDRRDRRGNLPETQWSISPPRANTPCKLSLAPANATILGAIKNCFWDSPKHTVARSRSVPDDARPEKLSGMPDFRAQGNRYGCIYHLPTVVGFSASGDSPGNSFLAKIVDF